MPPLATNVPDPTAIQIMHDWIAALPADPPLKLWFFFLSQVPIGF
jgi:hypothetical protein